jgi:hypothetical protein
MVSQLNWFHYDSVRLRVAGRCSVCNTNTNMFNKTTSLFLCSCACATKKLEEMEQTANHQDTVEGLNVTA